MNTIKEEPGVQMVGKELNIWDLHLPHHQFLELTSANFYLELLRREARVLIFAKKKYLLFSRPTTLAVVYDSGSDTQCPVTFLAG